MLNTGQKLEFYVRNVKDVKKHVKNKKTNVKNQNFYANMTQM